MKNATRTEHFRFVVHSENICHLILEEGVSFRPFALLSLPHFSVLSDEEKKIVITNLISYYQICLDVRASGHSLKETRYFTEKALQRFDLEMAPQDLELIENHHVVEIYDSHQTQIFRSFRFFETCSYTLEDILCRKWFNIYDRAKEDDLKLHQAVEAFYSASKKQAAKLNLGETIIRERDTLERLNIYTTIEWFIPLYKNGKFKAMMTLVVARN